MSVITIRLPKPMEDELNREAAAEKRPKSELIRLALGNFLRQRQKERFQEELLRAARSLNPAESLATAEEALAGDNEALVAAEGRAAYGRRKRPKR